MGLGIKSRMLNYGRKLNNYICYGFKSYNILFYPDQLFDVSVLSKIIKVNSYNIKLKNIDRVDLIIKWRFDDNQTPDTFMINLSRHNKVINLNSENIDKQTVDKFFFETFKYSTTIDPFTFQGYGVKKSLKNAAHDGQVIHFPVDERDENFIYQRLINNQVGEDEVLDYRLPIVAGHIPLVYLKYRPKSTRFGNANNYCELSKFEMHFTEEEKFNILSFCNFMKLDYAELDVVRDKIDNKIYILDVNTTPSGPPNGLKRAQNKKAIRILAKAFHTYLVKN